MHAPTSPHRAEDLAAGYTPLQHRINVVCLALFGALSVWVVYNVWSAATPDDGWLLALATLAGLAGADLLTGIVHWACDTWGRPESFLFGKVFIRSFREHHVDQEAITRHGFVQTNGEQCLAGLPMMIGLLLFPPVVGGEVGLFFSTMLFHVFFWTVAANQLHKWAHSERSPAFIAALQRARLFISRPHHQIHHTAPYTKYYCMVTGWMNEPLAAIGFWRGLEWVIHKVTGAVPREDDLGREVALRLMGGEWTPPAAAAAAASLAAPSSSADPITSPPRGGTEASPIG